MHPAYWQGCWLTVVPPLLRLQARLTRVLRVSSGAAAEYLGPGRGAGVNVEGVDAACVDVAGVGEG